MSSGRDLSGTGIYCASQPHVHEQDLDLGISVSAGASYSTITDHQEPQNNVSPPRDLSAGTNQKTVSAEQDSSVAGAEAPFEADPCETMEASGYNEMDHFHQRMKSDLMYELRNIQHGEKPVTGQNHRDQIQKFMEKYVRKENENTDLPRPPESGEDHRPDAVVVEVQGMIKQRPVSSILQSAAFRRQLENVIRGSIQSVQRRPSPVSRPRTHRPTSSVIASPAAQRIVNPEGASIIPTRRPGSAPSVQTDVSTERPQLTRHDSTESVSSVDSFSSARDSVESDTEDIDPEAQPVERTLQVNPNPIYSSVEQHVSSPSIPPEAVNRQDTFDTLLPNPTWNNISQIHREELVEEISDLLHSRLVSSTLDGEFRATLELLVQDRVSSSGQNGRVVQDFIRSLPRAGVVQNDFSHLGIPNPDLDNLDNVSVTSFSAHSVPYTQTNTHLSREIQSLKTQMNEMKNMLKMTFDLQMDIQRSIHQEVAAAMHSVAAEGATAAPVQPSKPVNDTHCIICLERHSDSVLYQCGHMCVCYICGKDLVSRNLRCPVCRAPIKDVIRAYKTNQE